MERIGVIIVAGGSGSRMGSEVPKQFMPLCGIPILVRTVLGFSELIPSADIVVAVPSGQESRWGEISGEFGIAGTHTVCEGDNTRFGSVKKALEVLPECDYVLVHDGVRPLFSEGIIRRGMEAVRRHGAAVPVVNITDSVRELTDTGSRPLERGKLRAVQTPQFFTDSILREAYKTEFLPFFTDDASVVESKGMEIALFEGEEDNIKITRPIDLLLAERILKSV